MYVVINGGGKVGEYLATVLLDSGHDVALIEQNEKHAEYLSERLQGRYMVIAGDGCNSRFQEDAGIRKADIFVASTGQDDANLVSCEIAQRVFEVPRCVARVNIPKNMRIFREVGIEGISSTALIANVIEEEALVGSVSAVTSLTHGNVVLVEVTIPRMRHHDNENGIGAHQIEMPEESLMVAVASSEEDVEVIWPETLLYPGDTVVIAADKDVLDRVRTVFRQL